MRQAFFRQCSTETWASSLLPLPSEAPSINEKYRSPREKRSYRGSEVGLKHPSMLGGGFTERIDNDGREKQQRYRDERGRNGRRHSVVRRGLQEL